MDAFPTPYVFIFILVQLSLGEGKIVIRRLNEETGYGLCGGRVDCSVTEVRSKTTGLPGPLPTLFRYPRAKLEWQAGTESSARESPRLAANYLIRDRLTAAHRKLPLGTTVRVTNLKNLASTLLRINDRGPGIGGRVIDVSWAAAKELGFLDAGLARVEIDVVSSPISCIRQVTSSRSPKLN